MVVALLGALLTWAGLALADLNGVEFVQMQTRKGNLPMIIALVFLSVQMVIFFIGDIYATTITVLGARLAQEAQRQLELALRDELTGIARNTDLAPAVWDNRAHPLTGNPIA